MSEQTGDTSKIMVTLPTKYYDILTDLKNRGIVSSYAAAVRDALIEWLDNHKQTFDILTRDKLTTVNT